MHCSALLATESVWCITDSEVLTLELFPRLFFFNLINNRFLCRRRQYCCFSVCAVHACVHTNNCSPRNRSFCPRMLSFRRWMYCLLPCLLSATLFDNERADHAARLVQWFDRRETIHLRSCASTNDSWVMLVLSLCLGCCCKHHKARVLRFPERVVVDRFSPPSFV